MVQNYQTVDPTYKLLLAHINTYGFHGAVSCPTQGIAGAGKTYMVMQLLMAALFLADISTLWSTKQNVPLISASNYAVKYKPSGTCLENAVARLLAKAYSQSTNPEIDLKTGLQQKDDPIRNVKHYTWPSQGLIILTTGFFAKNMDNLDQLAKFAEKVDVIVIDEAQQIGQEEDALLLAKANLAALVLLIGDNKQPNGAAPQQTQQLILKKSIALGAGLRAANIRYKAPEEYLRDFTQFFGLPNKNASTDTVPTWEELAHLRETDQNLQEIFTPGKMPDTANLLTIMKAFAKHPTTEVWTNYQMIGWSGLGGLTIPFSMRILDALYLIIAPNVYFHIFPAPPPTNDNPHKDDPPVQTDPDLGYNDTTRLRLQSAGFMAPITITPTIERLLMRPVWQGGKFYMIDERDVRMNPEQQPPDDIAQYPHVKPFMTASANNRMRELHDFGTYIHPLTHIAWRNTEASSHAPTTGWLYQVFDLRSH